MAVFEFGRNFGGMLLASAALAGLAGCSQTGQQQPAANAAPPAGAEAAGGNIAYSFVEGSDGKTILLDVPAPQNLGADGCLRVLRFASHGYDISWGDGTTTPAQTLQSGPEGDCPAHNRHTYKFPGVYEVVLRTWNVGPADQIIPLSRRTATIEVGGGMPESETQIKFLNVSADEPQYRLPRYLRWRQELAEPMALSFRILALGGALLATAERPLTANDGVWIANLSVDKDRQAALDAALQKSAQFAALVEVEGKNEDGRTVFRDEQYLAVTAKREQGTVLCPYRDYEKSGGMNMVITDSPGKRRYSYRIDWGDGTSAPEDRGIKPAGFSNSSRVSIGHTYAEPGRYTVRIYLDEGENPLPPSQLFEYCEIEFVAPFVK